MIKDLSYPIELIVIYGALVFVAVWGMSYLAPAVADQLTEILVTAVNQK